MVNSDYYVSLYERTHNTETLELKCIFKMIMIDQSTKFYTFCFLDSNQIRNRNAAVASSTASHQLFKKIKIKMFAINDDGKILSWDFKGISRFLI